MKRFKLCMSMLCDEDELDFVSKMLARKCNRVACPCGYRVVCPFGVTPQCKDVTWEHWKQLFNEAV